MAGPPSVSVILECFFFIHVIVGYEEIIYLDDECSNYTYYPQVGKSYRVHWGGKDPGFDGCKFTFRGRYYESLNRYKVCVGVEEIYFQSSGIYLYYYERTNTYPTKTYTNKDDTPDVFCGPEGSDVGVGVKADKADIFGLVRIDTSRSSFTLNVTAIKIFQDKPPEGTMLSVDSSTTGVVVAILGGLAIFGALVIIIVVVIVRYRRQQAALPPTQTEHTRHTGTPIMGYPQPPGDQHELPQQYYAPGQQLIEYPLREPGETRQKPPRLALPTSAPPTYEEVTGQQIR